MRAGKGELSLVLVLLAAALAAAGTVASVGRARTSTATRQVVVRPVTSTGRPRAGVTVNREPTGSVDCSFPSPSPAALSPNIDFCSPSVEYAVACWNAAVRRHVLCLRNPRVARLALIPRTGAFAAVGQAAENARAPLAMNLAGGDHCSIRDGGALGTLDGHPTWVASYVCDSGLLVWAAPGTPHEGVNESTASWTVRVAKAGVSKVAVRRVTAAWFVATLGG